MNGSVAILVILFFIALVLLGPIAFIWALNTLFPILSIPYTFSTWAAALILAGTLSNTVYKKN